MLDKGERTSLSDTMRTRDAVEHGDSTLISPLKGTLERCLFARNVILSCGKKKDNASEIASRFRTCRRTCIGDARNLKRRFRDLNLEMKNSKRETSNLEAILTTEKIIRRYLNPLRSV